MIETVLFTLMVSAIFSGIVCILAIIKVYFMGDD